MGYADNILICNYIYMYNYALFMHTFQVDQVD